MIHVLVTGSRHYVKQTKVEAAMRRVAGQFGISRVLVITGGATGADRLAENAAIKAGLHVAVIKPVWEVYGDGAGPVRNKVMLSLLDPDNKDFVIAFHENLKESRGTKDCVRQAKRKGLKVFYVA